MLNGGFGCISPSKRARAIADSEAAIGGRLTREQLESHNSFLVHVHEWLDFPMGTLKGLSAPLKLPGSPEQQATLSDRVRAQHRRIIELLHTMSPVMLRLCVPLDVECCPPPGDSSSDASESLRSKCGSFSSLARHSPRLSPSHNEPVLKDLHDPLGEIKVDATLALLRASEALPPRGSLDWVALALANASASAADGPAQVAEPTLARVDR